MSDSQMIEKLQAENDELRRRVAEVEGEQAELREQLQMFKRMADANPSAIYIFDLPTQSSAYANRQVSSVFDYDPSGQANISRINEMLHPDDLARLPEHFGRVMRARDGEVIEIEYRLRLAEDEWRWFVGRDTVYARDADGTPTQLLGTIQDITFRKQAEERLRLFEAVVENAVDGVAVSGTDGGLLYANPALLEMNGLRSLDEYLRHQASDFIDPADLESYRRQVQSGMRERGRWQGYSWARRVDGTRWRAFNSVFLIADEHGQTIGQAAITRDVTEQQQAEQERLSLQEQVIQAQQATLRELSTPLVPIADGVVAMPLIGSIDDARAQRIMETLLEGIGAYQAETAILDITGVKVVDTQVASALLRTARAVQLLGAQVVLTGISAEVAQALVHLEAEMHGIVTRSNFQSGIAYALGRG
jgi:rsbT co-antagonist protein RsbR